MKHSEVEDYNWDEGLELIWPLIHDSKTDIGTALLVYWRIEGPFLKFEVCRHNMDLWRMKRTLEERIVNGFYETNNITYDPVTDCSLSKTQVFKLKSEGVPIELFGKFNG